MTWVTKGDALFEKHGKYGRTPWGYSNDHFISYDDIASLTYKIKYMKSKGMNGLMYWALSGDLPESDRRSLLRETKR